MPNYPIPEHPLIGTTHTFRGDLPPYDGDTDRLPGRLIVANGMTVIIKAVFRNWNEVPGLDMLYVFCTATGMHTHVTPADLGITQMPLHVIDSDGIGCACGFVVWSPAHVEDSTTEARPVTQMVHEDDGEPCSEDPESYRRLCIHGWPLREVYTEGALNLHDRTPG